MNRRRMIPAGLRTGAAVVGAVAALSAPFVIMGYVAKHDTPEARERRIAAAYGRVSQSGTKSASAGYPRSSHEDAQETQDEEILLGCWRLQGFGAAGPLSMSATWFDECPVPRRPTLSAGEYPFPAQAVYLSAWGEGSPRMHAAHARAELSTELSDTEETEAALLFLPATTQGGGYFVAGWAQVGENGVMRRGMRIGHYGAPPVSVETSAGRVFMSPPTAPREVLEDATGADE